MNRSSLLAAAMAAAFAIPAAAQAGEATEALSQCLVENASPRDQATLMRWMFSAVSINPSLKGMTTLTAAERDAISRAMADMFQRLMLENCRKEVVTAVKADGDAALATAFEVMGRRAAEQLMSDKAASAELEKFAEHIDKDQWEALMKEAAGPSPKKR